MYTFGASGDTLYSNYKYDANGNITSYLMYGENQIVWDNIYESPTIMGESTYHYDTANQLVREDNWWLGKTFVWTYDDAGNITSCKEYAYTSNQNPVSGTPIKTNTYTYGDSSWGDLLTAYNGIQWCYDEIGNLTYDDAWHYTWRNGRELASMSNSSTTWNYTYDANGMRTSRSNGSTTYNYVYNGSQLTQMTKGSDTLYFTYGINGPTTVTWNGTTYYYALNAQGDVIGIFDDGGNGVVLYNWDNAWGYHPQPEGPMADTLGTLNPLRYRSYVYDEETELYYLQSRYYNPEICRWISPEPNVYSGGFDEDAGLIGYNVYAYCANNPVMYVDSDGESILLAMAIGAGVGALISGAVKAYQNYKSGQKWYKGIAISMLAGGVGGAISCISIPGVSSWVCAAVFGAVGNLTTKVILGEIKSIGDLTSAIAVGAGAGLLGNAASKVLIKGVTKYFGTLTKANQKAFLSRIGRITNAQLRAIRQQVSKGLTPTMLEQLVKKYGYDVLVSAFVSSTATSAK